MPDRLQQIAETCVRIDERTKNMQANHERELRAAHTRITEVRDEAKDDVAQAVKAARAGDETVRGEMKRLSGIISTAVSGLVSAVSLVARGMFGGD